MIHAYDEYYTPIAQDRLGNMLELAVYGCGLTMDGFYGRFLKSPVCKALEKADPTIMLGRSANELLEAIVGSYPSSFEQHEQLSPEYWTGWTLAYIQWYTARTFEEINNAYPIQRLLLDYFPFHEMDVSRILSVVMESLGSGSALKRFRTMRRLSQSMLSKISGVPLRTIRSYEQGKAELSKAQGETLYHLSKALCCSMEDLMK